MTHICRCSSKSVVQTAWISVLGVKSRTVLYRYYHNSTNVQLVETHWTGNLLCHLYSGRYRRENWSLHRPFGPHLPGLYMFVSKVYWYCYNLRCYRCAFKAQTAYFIFWWEPTAMIPFCHNGDVLSTFNSTTCTNWSRSFYDLIRKVTTFLQWLPIMAVWSVYYLKPPPPTCSRLKMDVGYRLVSLVSFGAFKRCDTYNYLLGPDRYKSMWLLGFHLCVIKNHFKALWSESCMFGGDQ